MKLFGVLILFLNLLLTAVPVQALGITGHKTVALIALSRLTPAARLNINRLLALELGDTLANISTWSDDHRDSSNTRWHYINFPRNNCHYVQQRDCPDGECVVEKIKTEQAILASGVADAQKLLALKILVHLVADIHQPLHGGFEFDRGGNGYQIEYANNPTNLHALWDNEMVDQFNLSPGALAKFISTDSGNLVSTINRNDDVSVWAEQSCAIVSSAGFYPPHNVSADYLEHYAPVMQLQLLRAGVRLANLLNALN